MDTSWSLSFFLKYNMLAWILLLFFLTHNIPTWKFLCLSYMQYAVGLYSDLRSPCCNCIIRCYWTPQKNYDSQTADFQNKTYLLFIH
ncbi:hypothetical protein XENTR_v10006661 [Xenopus tropicalis]|nr:hypothetical protein XENTR_v10006661 [Xenopus tropicalis]